MKKILEQVKDKDFDTVRLILLSKSFVFNLDIKSAKKIKDKDKQDTLFRYLAKKLKVPLSFIYEYAQSGAVDLKDIEAQTSVYWVYDLALENKKNIIDEDGAYIRFDPKKTDRFYKKVIKQLRSSFAFDDAVEAEKQAFVKSGGRSALHFLGGKKAKQEKSQHGSNFEQDVKIYLKCEECFTLTNRSLGKLKNRKSVWDKDVIEEDTSAFTEHVLAFAAEELGLKTQQVRRIYYEVTSRYHLPTLTKNPFPLDL